MVAIRAVDLIAEKWATVTPQRAASYEFGITNPAKDWKAGAVQANQAWKDGVTDAVNKNRFETGVTKAGTKKWQEQTLAKGVARWGPGVALAQGAYAAAFAPYREAILRVTLPPRFARRDPRNLLRVAAVVEALVKAKAAIAA